MNLTRAIVRRRRRLATGAAIAVPLAAPVNTTAPVISGTATTGETLSCTTGTWSGNPGPTYTYQWQNAGVNLGGATSSTYVLQATDEGDNITCNVTATNSQGSATATSNTIVPTAGYDADAVTYFAAMSVQPSTALKDLVDDLIVTLKADGVWTLIDWLGLGPMHDAQAARVNAKNPAQVATVVGAPTFTAKQGYAGDGSTACLDTGLAGSTLTATDGSMFVRVRTIGGSGQAVVGYGANGRITHGSGSLSSGRIVTPTSSTATTASASSQFICASRTGTTQTQQLGTAVEDTDTVATNNTGNGSNIVFLGNGTSFTSAQLSAWGFGKHLDNTNATALRSRLLTFITAAEAL